MNLNKDRNEQLKKIKIATTSLENEILKLVNKKSALSYNLERSAGWLFGLSAIGIFIAVFSQIWIGMVSMVIACLGCTLLIYKSRANISDVIDVNLWLSLRCNLLVKKCDDTIRINSLDNFEEIEACQKELEDIEIDRMAYSSGTINSSLADYYEKKYQKNKYSSKLKNKYNKHEIKQYM